MTLFSRFFRKAPSSPCTVDERIAMLSTASNDEESLRIAAIHKLPDGDALRRLAGVSGAVQSEASIAGAALIQAARSRMAQLIDAGSVDIRSFCDQVQDRAVMFAVVVLCKDTRRLAEALDSIDDPIQIAQLVVESPSSRLRHLAAQRVDDPAQLRLLLKAVRNKDKSVYKLLKQKCDALNAEERKSAEFAREAGALCASLERHSHRIYDDTYPSLFEHFSTRWRSLTTPPSAIVEERAQQAIDRCREVITEHLRQVAQRAAENAAQQAAHDTEERVRRAAQEAASAQADAEDQLRKEADAVRETQARVLAEKRAAEEHLFRQIDSLIRRANGALSDGHTQMAAGLRRAIGDKLPPAPAVPAHLARYLQQLDEKLNELKRWKDYAVAPKRIELIDEMEALIGSTEEANILADRIKSLQQDWRTISKGIVGDAPAEWERFHQASQAAYQPCREYFETQAKLRRANLENRKLVLERLTAFEMTQNAQEPEWRLLASVLREAPREWRRHFPVDREAGRTVQVDFEASMARLQARLDAWHGQNVLAKQSLVKRARQLLTHEDSREAIEAVKRLQILWKEAGQTPREQDQSLWSEFRELCDAVHQKRQQAYAEYMAGLEANRLRAVKLCEEAERIAALSGTDLIEGFAKIPEWRKEFEALDEMPRTDARGLHDRFERALDRCDTQMTQQQVRDAEQSFTNLFDAGQLLQAYEWAVVGNAGAAEREARKHAAESFIASVRHWPKGGLQVLMERSAGAESISIVDVEAREKALRTLCIRCEIQIEASTPPEDEALRREYQVQRLVQGMGQGNPAHEGDRASMVLAWIRIGAVEPTLYDSLQERFKRCRAMRPAPMAQYCTDHGVEHDGQAPQIRRHGRGAAKIGAAR